MIVTTVVLTNAAQAKCFPLSMPITYVCSYTSDLEPQLCLEPKWRSMELGKQHQHGPQNSYPISARGLEGFNMLKGGDSVWNLKAVIGSSENALEKFAKLSSSQR